MISKQSIFDAFKEEKGGKGRKREEKGGKRETKDEERKREGR